MIVFRWVPVDFGAVLKFYRVTNVGSLFIEVRQCGKCSAIFVVTVNWVFWFSLFFVI